MLGWRKIFVSLNKEDAYSAMRMLENKLIPCRLNVETENKRLSMNNLEWRNLALSRGFGNYDSNTFYHIYVKKAYVEYAKRIIEIKNGDWIYSSISIFY